MSAASRAREEQARQAALVACPRFDDDESPDPDDVAAKVIDWDFQRLLAGFVANRAEIAEARECRAVCVSVDGIEEIGKRPAFMGTIRHEVRARA